MWERYSFNGTLLRELLSFKELENSESSSSINALIVVLFIVNSLQQNNRLQSRSSELDTPVPEKPLLPQSLIGGAGFSLTFMGLSLLCWSHISTPWS